MIADCKRTFSCIRNGCKLHGTICRNVQFTLFEILATNKAPQGRQCSRIAQALKGRRDAVGSRPGCGAPVTRNATKMPRAKQTDKQAERRSDRPHSVKDRCCEAACSAVSKPPRSTPLFQGNQAESNYIAGFSRVFLEKSGFAGKNKALKCP